MQDSAKMKVFCVNVRVRPTPKHPQYFELQYGYLRTWIAGENPEEVGERAVEIAELLPYYEVVGEKVVVLTPKNESSLEDDFFYGTAKQLGLCLQLIATPTGSDEGNFENELEDGSWEQSGQ